MSIHVGQTSLHIVRLQIIYTSISQNVFLEQYLTKKIEKDTMSINLGDTLTCEQSKSHSVNKMTNHNLSWSGCKTRELLVLHPLSGGVIIPKNTFNIFNTCLSYILMKPFAVFYP